MAEEKNIKEGANVFVKMEEEVLKFWKDNQTFEKSVAKEAPRGEYVFYDGPPFATGTPHYGHLVASLMKDAVPRFWTMNGYQVNRKWGWDCHGLPIENIVEKELGIQSKKDIIENVGIEKFNALCRSKVFTYADEWKKVITRLGRWVDMEHPYRTMDLPYMESVWWAFKQLWDKDLVYKDYRSMHVCPRCETTLSQSEVAEGYKDTKDLTVTAKFELVDEPGTFVLAWTTTPWTLPGNVALAVGSGAGLDYQKLEFENDCDSLFCKKGDKIIFANHQHIEENIFGEMLHYDRSDGMYKDRKLYVNYKGAQIFFINKVVMGASELIGKKYKPPFDYYINDEKLANHENGWQIYHGDFVTTTDGTGVVHIAPAFGEDDMNLGRQYNLPFIQHVAMDGTFNKEMGEFAGLHVKPIDDVQATDVAIIKYLAAKGLLFSKEKHEHSYPFCWRCDTPLINYATSSWFINIAKMKDELLRNALPINWSPEHIKDGRFGKWLEGARDWSISRQRFWASCIPIWECNCGARKVLGSIEDFYQHADDQITKLVFVRHGESENNAADIIYCGTEKYGLTEKGRGQIAAAAEKLKTDLASQKDKIVFYASPLLRTKESAEIIGKSLGLEAIIDNDLREIDLGDWNDRNREDLEKNEEMRRKYLAAKPEDKMDIVYGNTGETQTQVGERMYNWLLKILPENQGKTILIVSHSDPIDDLISVLRGRSKHEAGLSLYTPAYHTHNGEIKTVYLNNSTKKEIDLHKDSLDKISLTCDVCGGEMKRIPDVLDCWFESGSMPYAQIHYPFENKERFEKNFPAEFIAEGIDQTRAWFYYVHVLANGIHSNYAYKNVIVNGIVLAEDGKKMSKRLKNYPDPELILEKHGADALRYYLLTSPVMQADNLNFSEKGVVDSLRKINMLLWNVYKFYEMYASSTAAVSSDFEVVNVLDKWIIARVNQLIAEVTDGMKKYDLPRATRPIAAFIDDFSTWYIRRSRDRFKEDGDDKNSALATTRLVLTDLAKVMAPFTPFIAEQLWQKVTGNNFANSEMSVHLEEWPNVSLGGNFNEAEAKILEKMIVVRKIVEFGLARRDEAGIKVRQPLAKVIVNGFELDNDLTILVKDELNVKEIIYSGKILTEFSVTKVNEDDKSLIEEIGDVKKLIDNKNIVELDVTMTPELIAEGMKRELVRFINAERKNADLTINDRIILQISTESEAVKNAVNLFETDLKKDVLADEIIFGAVEGKEVEANGEKAIIKIEKI